MKKISCVFRGQNEVATIPVQIEILHTQSVWRPGSRMLTNWIRWLSTTHPAPFSLNSICIITLDHAGISLQNQEILQHEGSTDVISCLFNPLPGSQERHADILVNVELAKETALNATQLPGEWSVVHELALYVFHGWDHVCGANDDTPVRRRAMRRRELGWVRAAVQAGLLGNLKSKIPNPKSGTRRRS